MRGRVMFVRIHAGMPEYRARQGPGRQSKRDVFEKPAATNPTAGAPHSSARARNRPLVAVEEVQGSDRRTDVGDLVPELGKLAGQMVRSDNERAATERVTGEYDAQGPVLSRQISCFHPKRTVCDGALTGRLQ